MTFEKLSDNLNLLIAEARLNANELARRTGIPASSIKKIRNNDNPNPTLSTLVPLANFFSITVSQLIGDTPLKSENKQGIETSHSLQQQRIPLISWSEAASWPETLDTEHTFITAKCQYSKNSFGLVLEEDLNEQFPKGTLLLIDCEALLEGRDYALVLKDNQNKPSIKQILIEDDQIFLKSLQLDNLIVSKSGEYKILGIVMEYRKYLK
jgi:transcriptional regulator with XRE-family HTH domain